VIPERLALTHAEDLIREFTRVRPAPFVPEVRLHLADELVPLWQATEWRAAAPQPPPFWAFAWPGSMALARFVFDHPVWVAGKRVLDYGAGCGLAAIAAVRAGAAEVVACDLDPLAAAAQQVNATLEGLRVISVTGDAAAVMPECHVVLAGDVCYEREAAAATLASLRDRAARGSVVLLADPGRHYAPSEGLALLESYDVPVLRELESLEVKRTRVWRVLSL
jgi:predicted nicotinamide N-methyase